MMEAFKLAGHGGMKHSTGISMEHGFWRCLRERTRKIRSQIQESTYVTARARSWQLGLCSPLGNRPTTFDPRSTKSYIRRLSNLSRPNTHPLVVFLPRGRAGVCLQGSRKVGAHETGDCGGRIVALYGLVNAHGAGIRPSA